MTPLHISEAPPDVIQPVEVVPAEPTAQAQDVGRRPMVISSPPPDVVQPVEVVPTDVAQGSSDGGDGDVSLKDPDHSVDIGTSELLPRAEPRPATSPLDNAAMYGIVREVAWADSGPDRYSAVSQDREWTVRGTGRHFGLGFGLILATQESGDLGKVLALTKKRDPAAFAAAFGPNAEQLLAVTNASTAEARLAPVGGSVLWNDPWPERFRLAGTLAVCQAAQNEQAIEDLFRPMLSIAFGLGFDSDRGLAMVFDRVVVRGLGGGLRWVVESCGPLRTEAQRTAALSLLGFDSVAHFQAGAVGLPKDGRFGPETHAALVAALRADGRVPLPSGDQLQATLLRTANGTARARLIRLRDSAALTDVVFQSA